MKKLFSLEGISSAYCAAKAETLVREIDGVQHAVIGFMAKTLMIEANEEDMDRISMEAEKACKKVEPDCVLQE